MARTCESRKNKGRRLQKKIVTKILEMFPIDLTASDLRSTPLGCTGEDVWMSEKAKKLFPYAVESKNTEKIAIWAALEQAKSQKRDGIPLLVFSRNHSEIYCSLKFDDFLNIIKENKELKSINSKSVESKKDIFEAVGAQTADILH